MTMTENEICRNYREAKNRPEQIKILADMNCTTADEIKRILIAGGEEVAQPHNTNHGKKKQDKSEPVEEKQSEMVLPNAVMDALTAELEALDMQIKLVSAQLNPLVDRYKEISEFIKSYGSV